MKNLLLIMNPGSRSGKSEKMFNIIFSELNNIGVSYDYRTTETLRDAYDFSRQGNREGYDVIVAVGGDGTINQVLNGFYDDSGSRISKSKFGIVYTGTSPDFCKSYDIPLNLKRAIKVVAHGNVRKINIGKVQYGNGKVGYFACCSNVGLGATLARKANSGIRKYLGDSLGTFLSLIHTLCAYKSSDVEIQLDDKSQKLKSMMNISVGLTKYIASGIKVCTALPEGDQRFYTLIVSNVKWYQWFNVLKSVYIGRIKDKEYMSLTYGKKIKIEGHGDVEYDGDPKGVLPCEISVAEQQLDLMYE